MSHPYSRNYFPPAPTVPVTLINPTTRLKVGPLAAFVDTGADATLVPLQYLREIYAPVTQEMMVRSQWGERLPVMLYVVNLQVDDQLFTEVEVVGAEGSNELILGRDVLNGLKLLLDGPQEMVDLLDRLLLLFSPTPKPQTPFWCLGFGSWDF